MSGADDPLPVRVPEARPDPWRALRALTPARVGLGRSGSALPTEEVLGFGLAHAKARDAVHHALDRERLRAEFGSLGLRSVEVASAAPDRATYLRRPDLGRQLSAGSRTLLEDCRGGPVDLAVVVADGLSATAVQAHAVPLLAAMLPGLAAAGFTLSPVVIAAQARVALGDPVGAILGARLSLVLIGERPGLSSPDSLGAYLTFGPASGRRDNERNCVSNIRPAGLSVEQAATSLLWLMCEALRRGLTGVKLKDESGLHLIGESHPPTMPRLDGGR